MDQPVEQISPISQTIPQQEKPARRKRSRVRESIRIANLDEPTVSPISVTPLEVEESTPPEGTKQPKKRRKKSIGGTKSLEFERDGLQFKLTGREVDVLAVVSTRITNEQIASELFISYATVRTHLRSIGLKVGTSNRKHLEQFAISKNVAKTIEPWPRKERAKPRAKAGIKIVNIAVESSEVEINQ